MERKLNEQWIEELDGKKHMLKVMENTTGGCKGCDLQVVDNCYGSCGAGDGCNFIVKDLGILNEEGCLPSAWDKALYPQVYGTTEAIWYAYAENYEIFMEAKGRTKQEAIDNWNRRA